MTTMLEGSDEMVDKHVQGKAGQAGPVVPKVLGIPTSSVAELGAVAATQKAPVVTAEQMELVRLQAEVARLKMERDIAKKPQSAYRMNQAVASAGF